ncbi:MAG: hypothetical protein AAF909_03435 [Pseudomonadota bacterium]
MSGAVTFGRWRCAAALSPLAALLALTACEASPESAFARAIEDALTAQRGVGCLQLRNQRDIRFPLRLRRPLGLRSPRALDPVLAGLRASGQITIKRARDGAALIDVIELTDKGKANRVWDPARGFCIGGPVEVTIVRYVFADQGSNQNNAEVTYRWRMGDYAAWVDPSDFGDVAGVSGPMEGDATLQKASDGWLVALDAMRPQTSP